MEPRTTARNDTRRVIRLIDPSVPSRVAESYRALRTNIQYYSVDMPLRRLLVTSALPGEGKSTTLANLAIAFAQTGQRVLAVDTDLRLPSLHRMFSLSNLSGLTDALLGNSALAEVIQNSPFSNLHILPAGAQPPNPSELLGSNRMRQLLAEIWDSYDLVLLDSPPVLAVTDASVLARSVDGVIVVIGARQVNREVAQRAVGQLEAVKARVLGVVLNGSNDGAAAGYFGGYYRSK